MVTSDSVMTQLEDTLNRLEQNRRESRAKVWIFMAVGMCLIISLFAVFFHSGRLSLSAFFISGLIGWLAFRVIPKEVSENYKKKFKTEVVSRMLKVIDPALLYIEDDGIGPEFFNRSALFGLKPDCYTATDLVSGMYNKTGLSLSKIIAQERRVRKRNGKRVVQYKTIFEGLFLIADFHKHFHGCTFVLPDKAEARLGKIGRGLQSLVSPPGTKLVQMEDPEFEKMFAVFSDDEIECRYILTPAMMNRLVELQERFRHDIQMVFKESCIWIAVPHSAPYLSPRFDIPATDQKQIRWFLSELRTFLDIVDELNLNTRIWTKE